LGLALFPPRELLDGGMVEKHYGHLATSYVREAIRSAKPDPVRYDKQWRR
jgi:hypothetical protein